MTQSYLPTTSELPRRRAAIEWLVRFRWPLLVAGILLAAAGYRWGEQLEFDRSIENMFADDDPLLEPFRRLRRIFGGDEVVLIAYVDAGLLTPEGVSRNRQMTEAAAGIAGVESALSIATTPLKDRILDPRAGGPWIDLLEGYVVGSDRQTAAVMCFLEPDERAAGGREAVIDRLRRLVAETGLDGVVAGEPVMVADGFRYIEQDGRLLGMASTALLMLALGVCFRSVRWVIVPLAIVYATLFLTRGLLVAAGLHLSMVSSMLWAIVTVIGVAMVVHVIVRFREVRLLGAGRRESLVVAGTSLAAPIVWTCLTDAVGFGALLVCRVGPIQDFGLMMLVGALLTMVSAAMLLPGLALAGSFDTDPRRTWGEGRLSDALRRLIDAIEQRPKSMAAVAALFSGMAIAGVPLLEVESDFTRNFRAESPVVQSYAFVESHLGGAGAWDAMVPVPPRLDEPVLERIRRLQTRLQTEVRVTGADGQQRPGLTKVLSVVDVIDLSDTAMERVTGVLDRFGLGGVARSAMSPEVKLSVLRRTFPRLISMLLAKDPTQQSDRWLRITLRSRERQSAAQKREIIDQVEGIVAEEFPAADQTSAPAVTGYFVLLASMIQSVIRDQWVSLGVAVVAIGLMMAAAFGSLRIGVIALVPNLVPILMVTGILGWCGVRINMGAAMIAAVSMGLAVDASIHYLSLFQALRSSGANMHEALQQTHQRVGRAIVFSTLALVVGFSTLCLSEFVPTVYFGVLVSLSLFGGLMGNLVVLPLLLQLALPESDATKREDS